MYIKKGDKVQVLSGKDRGKQGVILRALPAENKVVVEGVAVVRRPSSPTLPTSRAASFRRRLPLTPQRQSRLPRVR